MRGLGGTWEGGTKEESRYISPLSASWDISRNSRFFSLVLAPTRWPSLQGLSSTWHPFHGSSSHYASKSLRTLSPPSSHQGRNFFLLLLISKWPCKLTSQLFCHVSNFLLNFIYSKSGFCFLALS